jgi:hypothetical protein
VIKEMFFFKILSRRRYQQLVDERNSWRQQHNQLENKLQLLETEKSELNERLNVLQQTLMDFESLQQDYQKLNKQIDLRVAEETEKAIKELGGSRTQIEKLWAHRSDLIELYIKKLYSLAQNFARANKEMRKNRGLFLLLVDGRNMVDGNFSEFHDGQTEHLMQSQYRGIDQLPHIFSPKITEVFSYMGEKVILKDEKGEITGHEERDGALLIDLTGITFRSCMMVEGVRTHRVYSKVERLHKGSAKHNAAIYASSLNEVMAAIVISEETSEVTLFRDGRLSKTYNPYTDVETPREEKVVPLKRGEGLAKTIKEKVMQTSELTEGFEDENESTLVSLAALPSSGSG